MNATYAFNSAASDTASGDDAREDDGDDDPHLGESSEQSGWMSRRHIPDLTQNKAYKRYLDKLLSSLSWMRRIPEHDVVYDALPCQEAILPPKVPLCTLGSLSFSLRAIVLSSWANVLLIFVPAGIAASQVHAPPAVVFGLNAIAIVPLSSLLAYATECIANELGDTIGALMNISFGNIVEVVMFCVGLVHGEVKVVQGALVGSILVNLLLILGTAVIAGAFRPQAMVYDMNNAQGLACLLSLSVFSVLIPTALHYTFSDEEGRRQSVLTLSRASAIILLAVYGIYLIFLMKPGVHHSLLSDAESLESRGTSFDHRVPDITIASRGYRTIRFADENSSEHSSSVSKTTENIALEDIEQDGRIATDSFDQHDQSIEADSGSCRDSRGHHGSLARTSHAGPPEYSRTPSRSRSRSRSLSTHRRPRHSDIAERYGYSIDGTDRAPLQRLSSHLSLCSSGEGHTVQTSVRSLHRTGTTAISRGAAVVLLIASSLLVAVCADFLVGTIADLTSDTAEGGILSESFIGLIILPIAGNAAEHITAVTVALKGKLDLAIGVSLGSSIQIALFVSPLMVIVGWILGQEMTLYFGLFETVVLVGSGMLVNFLIWNGKTNYLEGAMLCACYAMIGVGAFLIP